jgi:hypothetical protein
LSCIVAQLLSRVHFRFLFLLLLLPFLLYFQLLFWTISLSLSAGRSWLPMASNCRQGYRLDYSIKTSPSSRSSCL